MNIASVQAKRALSHTLGLACRALVVLSFVSGVKAATIEEVEKEIIQAQSKLKSYSAVTETRQDMELGPNQRMKLESKGPMVWMHRDAKYLFRMELKSSSVTTINGDETRSKSDTLTVCDGDFMYTLSDSDGQKSAIKAKVDPSHAGDVKGMFAAWRKDSTLKVLPEEKVDGKDCYVVELLPRKKEAGEPFSRQKFWFRKDIGLPVKIVAFGQEDKPAMTTTMTDVKTDVDVQSDRFKFKLPEGVQLMDLTEMQAASAPASHPEAEETRRPSEPSTGTEQNPQQAEGKPQKDEQSQEAKESDQPPEKKEENAAKSVLKKIFK